MGMVSNQSWSCVCMDDCVPCYMDGWFGAGQSKGEGSARSICWDRQGSHQGVWGEGGE